MPLPELKIRRSSHPLLLLRLHDAERDQIPRTLRDTRWVIGGPDGAAARLGLKRTTLTSKIKNSACPALANNRALPHVALIAVSIEEA